MSQDGGAARPIGHLRLHFDEGRHAKGPRNLSAVEQLGATLWLGADEGSNLDRLSTADNTNYDHHTTYSLGAFFNLPGGKTAKLTWRDWELTEPADGCGLQARTACGAKCQRAATTGGTPGMRSATSADSRTVSFWAASGSSWTRMAWSRWCQGAAAPCHLTLRAAGWANCWPMTP